MILLAVSLTGAAGGGVCVGGGGGGMRWLNLQNFTGRLFQPSNGWRCGADMGYNEMYDSFHL